MRLELDLFRGRYNRAFGTGLARGLTRTLEDVLTDKRAQRLRKQFNLDRDLLQEEEDERDTGMLKKLIDTDADLAAEERESLLALLRTNKAGKQTASAEERELVNQRYESLKSKKSAAGSGEAERLKADAEIKDEYDAELARIQALPEEQRARFQHYQTVEKPTKGKLNALKDDLKLYFEETKAGRTFENQLKLKEFGASQSESGGGSSTRAADQPKTSKELLDKAYQDFRASMKDAEELELIAKLVGSETPAGAKRSFREYLTDWLPNVGRVFNAEVADSMESALKGAQPAAGASGSGAMGGAKAPAASGAQVPEDLVERARRALDSIERQIQAFEAKR